MFEEPPKPLKDSQLQHERAEDQNLESKHRIAMDRLKTLMDEGLRLVADPDVSLDRLFEINREERTLIDRLEEIERDIAAEKLK
jgi:hypothetical protein